MLHTSPKSTLVPHSSSAFKFPESTLGDSWGLVWSVVPANFFLGSVLKLLRARDGDEAIPPFFFHLGSRIAFFTDLY